MLSFRLRDGKGTGNAGRGAARRFLLCALLAEISVKMPRWPRLSTTRTKPCSNLVNQNLPFFGLYRLRRDARIIQPVERALEDFERLDGRYLRHGAPALLRGECGTPRRSGRRAGYACRAVATASI